MDNIAVNGIANNDIGCFLCSFLLFGGGCLVVFFKQEHDPNYSLLLLSHINSVEPLKPG